MSATSKFLAREIVTPVTIVAFAVSTVTGIMLLLHWNAGLVRFSHEWLSVVFSAVAIWHLVRNWTPFLLYLKRNAARAAFLLSLLGMLAFTGLTGSTSPVNPGAVFRALSNATLETAAPALGIGTDRALGLLAEAGIAATPTDTLQQIGTRSGLGPAGVASTLATAATSAATSAAARQ